MVSAIINPKSLLQNDKILSCALGGKNGTNHFFLVISDDSEKSRPLNQDISPVGRNDTACKRSFCKRLLIII